MRGDRLRVRLLGPVEVVRDGEPVVLPPSRKVLVLLAFLALETSAQTRARLCDLLWDVPNDPRGELRWCLSKLRAVIDAPDRTRVVTTKDLVSLDLSDAFVDAREVERAREAGTADSSLFRGDFLEGVEVDGSPELTSWLMARRQQVRAARVAVAKELVARAAPGTEEAWRRLEEWIAAAPFDSAAHEAMLAALLAAGRVRDGEEHLARMVRAFEQEGIDWAPLRATWPKACVVPSTTTPEPAETRAGRRASIAIMPFTDAAGTARQLAHGVTDDIITRLAKLRALFVIARGTSYALGDRGVEAQEAGRILGVEYVVSGRVRSQGARTTVVVELAETRDAQIVWTDELAADGDAAFGVLDTIVDRIVAAIAEEVEAAECRRSVLKPPASLDAWEAYHRGLWHMYKFTQPDNLDAERFFRQALALDPTFARAYSGLSFTHFQNVFLELTPDRERQVELAYSTAAQSVGTDERDPAAHWAMGRALWLRGATSDSVAVLQRSIELSPNFALGHYMLGFVEAQSGDPKVAIGASNTSRALSPFDPLQFGMLGSRALAHVRLGEADEAVSWAMKAVARPNAHAHILAIGASTLALAKRKDDAQKLIARIRERIPTYTVEHFLRAFRFDPATEQLLRKTARTVAFDR